MKLNTESIKDKQNWEGYILPGFDVEELRKKTHDNPCWVHFGSGNIFRAFIAADLQKLIDAGLWDRGIICAACHDFESVDKVFHPYDELCVNVTLKADGSVEKRVIASITETLKADKAFDDDWNRLCEIFRSESLQMVSITITEKGHAVSAEDAAKGFDAALPMGKLAALLLERFNAGAYPLTVQSMDNFSHNGDKVRDAVLSYVNAWKDAGICGEDFAEYVSDRKRVSFPWCMIDKITPRPDENVLKMLEADGLEDMDLVKTAKGSYTAPFVNAEETEYLIIEDSYVNGRPPLEKAGFMFTDADTVDKVERMKVCTCLNPLHTAMAILGCLLGYTRICEEMKDGDIAGFITRMGREEGLPAAEDPGIIRASDFMDTVIYERLPNPFMPDAPQRIATDTSQKLPIRFGETLKTYISRGEDISRLDFIPFVFAAYARYLTGIDDEGREFEISADPMLGELKRYLSSDNIDEKLDFELLKGLYSRKDIFGVDLIESGLSDKLDKYIAELFRGKHSVRNALHKIVSK